MLPILETVRKFVLDSFLPGEDPSALTNEADLHEAGVLDSFSTLRLVSFLEHHFTVELRNEDLKLGRLSSVEKIECLVRERMSHG